MAECTPVLRDVLIVLLCILTAVMLLCLIRAVRGPRYTDRLAALNLICTVVGFPITSARGRSSA